MRGLFRITVPVHPSTRGLSLFALLILFGVALLPNVSPGVTPITAQAPIKAVTVYPDQARISRTAALRLETGQQSIVIDKLPVALNPGSLRASVTGPRRTTILRLTHQEKQEKQSPSSRIAELQRQIDSLSGPNRQALTDRLEAFTKQKELLCQIAASGGQQMTEQVRSGTVNVGQWEAAYDFVGRKLTQINDSIRLVTIQINAVEKRLLHLKNEIFTISNDPGRASISVQVDLRTSEDGPATLTLEYMIGGASWTPLYDARLNSQGTEVEFTAYGEVTQRTGEEWENIDLSLSTAQPSSGTSPQALAPWNLNVHPTYAAGQIKGRLVDKDTKEPIIGASVMIVGTKFGAMTDPDGNFIISRLDPGTYATRIQSPGYCTVEVRGVAVKPDLTTDLSQRLEKKVTDIGRTITVTAANDDAIQKYETSSWPSISSQSITSQPVQNVDYLTHQVQGRESFIRGGRQGDVSYTLGEVPSGDAFGGVEAPPPPIEGMSLLSDGAVFKALNKETVKSGGEAVRAPIGLWTLQAETKLLARPHSREGVFRQVTVTNQSQAPLLPGKVAIFAESDFLGYENISGFVAPRQTFSLGFGMDNRVTAKREVLSFRRSSRGNTSYIDQTIKLTVDNHSTEERLLTLEEPLPVSRDGRIKIKTDDLAPKADSVSHRGIATWKVRISAGEKRDILVPYRIEYPSSVQVLGLVQ